MKNEFAVACFLDECRWDSENLNNYNLINFAHSDLTNEEKLLTHWVSYITDRQMPYELIWDVGGFVLSDMVKHYGLEGTQILTLRLANPFFTGSAFKARLNCPADNDLLLKRKLSIGLPVEFTSRFYPSDYVSILFTLNTLECYDRDFVEYMLAILNIYDGRKCSPTTLVRALAYGLHLLSYDNIGRQNKDSIATKDWFAIAKKRTDEIKVLFSDKKRFTACVETFFKDSNSSKRYNSKRVWCSLRDYIKSPEFSSYFRESLINKQTDEDIVQALFSEESKQTIELPGDVWNQNPTFRHCLLELSGTKERKGVPFNRLLRKLFEEEKLEIGYPEQFDVTFDFVPRMCEKRLCDICPFKAVYDPSRTQKTCVNDVHMFCPISLISCGYVTNCKGDKCSFRGLLEKQPMQSRCITSEPL